MVINKLLYYMQWSVFQNFDEVDWNFDLEASQFSLYRRYGAIENPLLKGNILNKLHNWTDYPSFLGIESIKYLGWLLIQVRDFVIGPVTHISEG